MLAAVCWTGQAGAQVLNNQSLSGKYFFRHVSLGLDSSGNLSDPRSLIGSITFNGSGNYSFVAQQVIGGGAPTSQSGSGLYSVDSAGFVSLDSPLRSGIKVNARFGSGVLLGATTESADNTYDVFAAIQAPTGSVSGTLTGPFWGVSLEFPGGTRANARNTFFGLNPGTAGQFNTINVTGHAANLAGGLPATQTATGATYSMGTDGAGTVNFGTTSSLLSGSRTLYVSADGNLLLGGSTTAGAHDILIAVKAATGATNATWTAPSAFWGAGLRIDSTGGFDYAASLAARGTGSLTWSKRYKQAGAGAYDFTGVQTYNLNADGSGTLLSAGTPLGPVAVGAGGKTFVGAIVSPDDPGGYEIYFGTQMTAVSGTGVFLNPQGILNAASYAPAGNPISPGEYVSLFGSGLAPSARTALPPYPLTLNTVTVLVNGKQAPLYYVSATQINALIPYATTGPTATIVVQNGSANSNTVTVPVAATSPGFFALNQAGSGNAAVYHGIATRGPVTADNPASPGETVVLFLAGMGAVNPPVADGNATSITNLSMVTASPVTVYIGGQEGRIDYKGLAPNYPGLYQFNVVVPVALSANGAVPLAIGTPNAFHDQVLLPVQ